MVIGILAVKGNIGRSTFIRSLSSFWAKREEVSVYEMDVSNPKLISFYPWNEKTVKRRVSRVDHKKCDLSGRCFEACNFGAILRENGRVTRKPYFCRGCGRCKEVCPKGAIYFEEMESGQIGSGRDENISFFAGRLSSGDAWEGRLIKEIKESYPIEGKNAIFKAPLGLGAMSLRAIKDADTFLLVTSEHQGVKDEINTFGQIVQGFDMPGAVVFIGKRFPEDIRQEIDGHNMTGLFVPFIPELGNAILQEKDPNVQEVFEKTLKLLGGE